MASEYQLLDLITHDQLHALQQHYHHPHRRLYIPGTLADDHPLTRLLGPATAKIVVAAMGGSVCTLSRSQLLRRRNAAVIADRAAGMPAALVASRHSLAERTVRHICQQEQNRGRDGTSAWTNR